VSATPASLFNSKVAKFSQRAATFELNSIGSEDSYLIVIIIEAPQGPILAAVGTGYGLCGSGIPKKKSRESYKSIK